MIFCGVDDGLSESAPLGVQYISCEGNLGVTRDIGYTFIDGQVSCDLSLKFSPVRRSGSRNVINNSTNILLFDCVCGKVTNKKRFGEIGDDTSMIQIHIGVRQ